MKKIMVLFLLSILSISLLGCFNQEEPIDFSKEYPNSDNYYQLFVRSFADSDGDGIGDFNGIKENLDYFETLGIEGIWLMPIHPTSTMHGYDVEDYYDVNPEYGTLEDFEALLDEANARGIDIIIDYVLNHSSNKHPWFENFKNGVEPYTQYYRKITSSDPRFNQNGAWGQNIWHRLNTNYYYAGYFGGNMPDLNWSSPVVQDEMVDIAHYWLEKGVAGFRLDAAMHLQGVGEIPASFSSMDETLFALSLWEFRVKEEYPNAFIIGEVWDSFSTYSNYLTAIDSVFHFEYGDLVVNSLNANGNFQYVDEVIRSYDLANEKDSTSVLAPFLKNHDQHRMMSLLNDDIDRAKLAAEMLLSLPGAPFIYYGEELGVKGVKSGLSPVWDESVRLPMLWENDYKPTWPIDLWDYQDTFNDDVDGVQTQIEDDSSIFNVYSRLFSLRKSSLALRYGAIVPYELNNTQLQGFYRVFNHDEDNQEIVLVLHNLGQNDAIIEATGDVLYYTHYDFDGILSPKSTVILTMPNSMIEDLEGHE
ncbi:MAG: alpha-amylase family glycosyl hydrolase [Candidatus Izemoplasmataceae bacterium]